MVTKGYLYIFKKVFYTSATLLIIISSIIWVIEIINISRVIYSSAIEPTYFIKLCCLLLPYLLFILSPIAVFCAVWFIMHSFVQSSELIAFKSAGASDFYIAKPILGVSIIFMLFGYFITFFVYPNSQHKLNLTYRNLQEKYILSVLKKKVFNNFNGNTIYFEDIDKEGNLKGLIIIKNEVKNDSHFITAVSARFIQEPSNPLMILLRGTSDYKWSKEGEASVMKSDETKISIGALLKLKQRDSFKKPKEMSLCELYKFILSTKYNKKYLIELHLRLIWPYYSFIIGIMTTLVMLLKISPRNLGKFDEIKIILFIIIITLFGILGTYILAISKAWPLIYAMPICLTIVPFYYYWLRSRKYLKYL